MEYLLGIEQNKLGTEDTVGNLIAALMELID